MEQKNRHTLDRSLDELMVYKRFLVNVKAMLPNWEELISEEIKERFRKIESIEEPLEHRQTNTVVNYQLQWPLPENATNTIQ